MERTHTERSQVLAFKAMALTLNDKLKWITHYHTHPAVVTHQTMGVEELEADDFDEAEKNCFI